MSDQYLVNATFFNFNPVSLIVHAYMSFLSIVDRNMSVFLELSQGISVFEIRRAAISLHCTILNRTYPASLYVVFFITKIRFSTTILTLIPGRCLQKATGLCAALSLWGRFTPVSLWCPE